MVKKVQSLDQLERAWRAIQDNARTSKSEEVRQEVDEFHKDSGRRIRSLCNRLARKKFTFVPAKGIPIPKAGADGKKDKTKFRPIVLAPLESRIVQRSVLETLASLPGMHGYINTPYSFGGIRKSKGAQQAAVPAAISCVLENIGSGAKFVASADIRSFFTRISKTTVREIIADVVRDDEFMALFDEAIKVELSNMIELKEKAAAFPIEDIGVAQGNSLSPLLGNIILFKFDQIMNEGDCRCIRYIDDFIILAPTKRATKARLQKTSQLLAAFGMELSPEKSSKEPFSVDEPIMFLGIELNNGLIRPAAKATKRFLSQIEDEIAASINALRTHNSSKPLAKTFSLVSTLKRIDGIVQGWGKHYRFCNDGTLFSNMDNEVKKRIGAYLGAYADIREKSAESERAQLLGMQELSAIDRKPLIWLWSKKP